MTQYDETIPNVEVAFKPTKIENTFGEYISKLGYSQLRIAELDALKGPFQSWTYLLPFLSTKVKLSLGYTPGSPQTSE